MKRKAEPNFPTPSEHPDKKQIVAFTKIRPNGKECGPNSMSFTPRVEKTRIHNCDYIARAIIPPIHSDEYPHFPPEVSPHIIHVRAATKDPRVLALSLLTYTKDLQSLEKTWWNMLEES
jgi:hypothetical protein